MRQYAQVWPGFWSGETGRALAQLANDGDLQPQRVAFHLMTNGAGTFSGLYYLPLPTLVFELGGIDLEGARKALRSLHALDFARYDEPSAQVWVVNAVVYNIGENPNLRDNRVIGLQGELETKRKSPFYQNFCERYAHLLVPIPKPPRKAPSKDSVSPLQGGGVSVSVAGAGAVTRSRSGAGENARSRARPAPPSRLRPAEQTETPDDVTLTPEHLGTLFDQRWRALGNAAPPLPRDHLAELADRVARTAADRGEPPAQLLEQALTAWGSQPRNDREVRGPVECFARDFGEVIASLAPPAGATSTRDLMAERNEALRSGDTARYEQLNDELRALNGGRHAAAR